MTTRDDVISLSAATRKAFLFLDGHGWTRLPRTRLARISAVYVTPAICDADYILRDSIQQSFSLVITTRGRFQRLENPRAKSRSGKQ